MQKRSSLLPALLLLSLMTAPLARTQPRLGNLFGAKLDEPKTPPLHVQVSSAEMGKLLVKKVPPEYPEKARSQMIQGTVLLRAIVSKEGNVVDVSVISGDPDLSKAALKAAKKWKYHPYLVGGEPVEVETTIQMNFRLSTN